MKKNIFIVLLLFPYSFIYSQNQPLIVEPKTELEKFFSKEGVLVIKEFTPELKASGNSLTDLSFQKVKVYYPGDDKSVIVGLKITVNSIGKKASAFLDVDEVESLYRAMQYILEQSSILKQKKDYTEIVFSTKDDFKFGCFLDDEDIILFASLNKYPYPSFNADFDQLVSLQLIISNYIKEFKK